MAGRSGRAGGGDARKLARDAQARAGELEREDVPWARSLAALARAGAARLRDDAAAEANALADAAHLADAAEMTAYADAARWRLGLLRGQEDGARDAAAALASLRGRGMVAPERLCRMLLGAVR